MSGSAGPARAGSFPSAGTGSRFTGARPSPRRLVHLAFAVLNRLVPKHPGRVVLHSTADVEDGQLAVIEECVARGWRPMVLLEDPGRRAEVRSFSVPELQTVPKRSLRGIAAFLTARYVVTTSRLYGDYPPPRTQTVVSLWHGEPPTKVVGRFSGRAGVHTSCAPVCSTVGRAYRAAEFGIHPLRVPIVGAPRNDRMLRTDRAAVRSRLLGDAADRPTLLWMPSFRIGRYGVERRTDIAGESASPFPPSFLQRLDEWLDSHGARIVIKVHPRDAETFPGAFRAMEVLAAGELPRRGVTLYQALPAFDGLITDMSSIWLDYLLLDKPIIFAFPDLEDYRRGRGLNLEPYEHWVPGPFARTVDELLAAVEDVVEGRDPTADERRRARLRFHQFTDDASTARLLDLLGIDRRSAGATAGPGQRPKSREGRDLS